MRPTSKQLMREFSLVRFYCILALSLVYFAVQFHYAYTSHSLVLQIDSYHMLYNILSLITCILTIRFSRTSPGNQKQVAQQDSKPSERSKTSVLKNTFGWARIDVCGVVANLCVLLALCFSVVVDALQTIFHVSHHNSMTNPKAVAIVAGFGIVLNFVCILSIGGYTFHQTGFLHTDPDLGNNVVISDSVQTYVQKGLKSHRCQGLKETFRDTFGTVLVLACAIILIILGPTKLQEEKEHPHLVIVSDSNTTTHTHDLLDFTGAVGYIDPLFCMVTAAFLVALSYSYAKEACRILLLTIPDHIDVKSLLEEIRDSFPEICDIHDFHVWQLTPARVIFTAHIVLHQNDGYLAIQNSIVDFLHNKGISHITLQPEFLHVRMSDDSPNVRKRPCFLPCDTEECRAKMCCEGSPLTSSTPCGSHLQVVSIGTCPSSSNSSGLPSPTSRPSERYPEEAVAFKEGMRSDEENELHPMI